MNFKVPENIYIEKNCVSNHKNEICAFGKKALIVTGCSSSRKNCSLDDIILVLNEGKIPFSVFDQVEENPSVETVFKASRVALESGCDFVIGIGGGSPLDCAKAAAILAANPDEAEDCLYNPKALGYLPVIAVPTTCGTGSEVTPYSVLTNHKIGTKKSLPHKVYPALALIDGKYLLNADRRIIINTALDALSHLVESHLNSKADKVSRGFSEYGLELWAENKDFLLNGGAPDEKTCENLMLCSMYAGLAISVTGTSLPHGMSYDLTYKFNVPHGKACAFFLGAYLDFCARDFSGDIERILSLLKLKDIREFSEMILKLNGIFKISRQEKNVFLEKLTENKKKLSSSPCPVTTEELDLMYEKSLVIEE